MCCKLFPTFGQAALAGGYFWGPELTKSFRRPWRTRFNDFIILAFLTKGIFISASNMISAGQGLLGYASDHRIEFDRSFDDIADQFVVGNVIGASFVARYAVP